MSGPVSYNELFDGLGPGAEELLNFTKNVKGLNTSYKTFAKNLEGDSQKIAAGLAVVLAAINGTKAKFEDVNVVSRRSRTTLDELSGAIAKLAREQQELKERMAGVGKIQKDTEAATKGLNSALKQQQDALKKAFAAGDLEAAKAAAREIIKLKAETDNLSRALRGANSDFTAAAGSFRAMENEARQLDAKLKSLAGGMDNNSAEAQQLKAQLAEVNEKLRTFTQETGVGYRNVGRYAESLRESVSALNTQRTELLANADALRTQMQATGLTVEQQERLQQELKQTDAELAKNSNALKQYGVGVKSGGVSTAGLTSNLSGLTQTLAGAYYGIQGVATALQEGFESNLKYSASLADVRKTTGLTADAAEELADSLKQIPTSTSLSGLLDIAKVGGQLGIAKENIRDFTAAIDIANQALGDDFGADPERIATELGKIANVFKKDLGPDIAKNLLSIGSAVNEIGAEGAATAPFLTDVALRVGQMSAAYGVGLKNVIAYAAVLEESGSSAERAGTSLNRLFSTIAGKTKASFEIAKLGDTNLTLKQFTKLVNSDFNGAIQAFLKGLNAGGTSTTKVNQLLGTLKLQSGEAKNTILALAQNTDLFAQRQSTANDQLEKATSLGAEAAIKVDTLDGSWSRFKNTLSNFVTNGQVGGFLKSMVNGINNLLGDLGKFSKATKDTTAATLATAQSNRVAADSANALMKRYEQLTEKGVRPTAKSKEELGLITEQLTLSLGSSVSSIDKETGALILNEKAARDAIKQKILLSNQAVSTLILEADQLDENRKKEELAIKAQQSRIKNQEKLLGLTVEQARQQVVDFTNETADGVMSDRIKQADELYKRSISLAGSFQNLARINAEYNQKLEAMDKLGAKSAYLAGGFTKPAIDANKDLTKSIDDTIEADKEKKKSIADVAAEEYKRRKQLLEFEAEDLARQAKNPANTEAIRLRALQKERDVREEIAKLDLNEGSRLAAQSNKDKIDGDRATKLAQRTLTDKYNNDIRQLGIKLSKDEIALHNATLEALSQTDRANIEQQIKLAEDARDNVNKTYEERQQAAQDVSDYQVELARLTRDSEVRAAEGALDKIAAANQKYDQARDNARKGVKFFDSGKAIDDIERDYVRQQLALEDARGKQLLTEKEYRQKLDALDYQREFTIIEALEREYGVTENTLRRKAELRRKYNEADIKQEQEAFDKRMELIKMGLDFVQETGNAGFQVKAESLRREQDLNEKTYQSATKAAGENSLLKQQAEEQYFKKKNELARKQFENDKKAALFQIALSTAMGVASVLSTGGPARYADAGIGAGILIAGVLASGVAQAAVVLSRQPPLPEYFKGRDGGPAEFAWVAERGPELIESKSGGSRLVENKQITYLKEGDKVHTADKTRRLLAEAPKLRDPAQAARRDVENTTEYTNRLQQQTQLYLSPYAHQQRDERMARTIVDGVVSGVVSGTRQALHDQPAYQVTEKGIFLYTKSASSVTKHLNSRHRRNG
jgi:TP901 family phage tail tape measure protein